MLDCQIAYIFNHIEKHNGDDSLEKKMAVLMANNLFSGIACHTLALVTAMEFPCIAYLAARRIVT